MIIVLLLTRSHSVYYFRNDIMRTYGEPNLDINAHIGIPARRITAACVLMHIVGNSAIILV